MGNPFQPLSIALWSIGSIAVLGYHVSLGSLEMGTPCTQALSWTKVDPRIEWSLFDEHIWNVWNILNYVYYVIPQRIEKIRNVYQYILMNIGKIPFSSFFGVITHIYHPSSEQLRAASHPHLRASCQLALAEWRSQDSRHGTGAQRVAGVAVDAINGHNKWL